MLFWFLSPAVRIEYYQVETGSVTKEVMGTGTLEARVKTTISPKISGRIATVLVDQSDLVKKGELLVQLDDEDLQQQVRIASAGITTAEATLGRFQAEIEQSKSTYSKTEADLGRSQKLLLANSISQSEFDQSQESFELAKSGLIRAEANLREAQQQVELNRETLRFQETRLADTRLVAPFDGLIIQRQRDPGSIVVPGSPILQLISLDELWINAWVDETEIEHVKIQQLAQIIFRSNPNKMFRGKVARMGKQADRETREFTLDIEVLSLPDTWAVGQRAEVYIETSRIDDCIVIPTSYLKRRDRQVGVFIEKNGLAFWQSIQIGLEGRDRIEVIDGLQVGDVVITPSKPDEGLRNGQKVIRE